MRSYFVETYMRKDDLVSHEHQVIHADSGPLSPTSVAAAHAQLGTHLSCLVQKQPYLLALLDPTASAGRVGTIVEDERHHHFCCFDRRAHDHEVMPRKICLLCFTLQCSLGHDSRLEADAGVGAQLLLRGSASNV
jgi:hypothetical protein